MGIPLDLGLVIGDRHVLGPGREINPDHTGEGQGLQERDGPGQVAEPLPVEQGRGEGREGVGPDGLPARPPNLRIETQGEDRLMRIALEELVLAAYLQVAEPEARRLPLRDQAAEGLPEGDAEVRGDALRELEFKLGLLRCRLVA